MEVPVWERVTMRLDWVSVSGSLSGVGSGMIFKWVLFLRTAPDGVSTRYDLGDSAGSITLPSMGSLSVVITTSDPSGTVPEHGVVYQNLPSAKLSIGFFELRKI